uniref:HMA domain-containing protein n=1 Tax=Cannabis sativa TaxID=3483 RepID=A0A803P5R3_CANSA
MNAGVESVEIDGGKDLVTVKGTMDVKELSPYLQTKLKRSVDVVPPPAKKDDGAKAPAGDKKDAGAGDKKGKDAAPAPAGEEKKKEEKKEGGGEKKADGKAPAAAPADVAPATIVNKMEYFGYGQPSAMYYEDPVSAHNRYVMEAHAHQAFVNDNYAANHGYPMNNGYGVPMDPYHAPQMFSDENPNACSVM